MKRIGFILASLFLAITCKAVSLFPFFVDLVGEYSDGPLEQLQPLGVECLYSDKCNFFNSIEDADTFLDDVLPYKNYPILRKKIKMKGLDMEIYASLLEDDRSSVMCLIEMPEDGLYVIYDELPGNPFKVE